MVYLNGKLLRNHSCGYTSYSVRLDNQGLLYGQPNVLSVYCDATSGSGWWYEGGGLYRDVHLIKTGPVHFGFNGTDAEVFAKPVVASDGASGSVAVTAAVVNSGTESIGEGLCVALQLLPQQGGTAVAGGSAKVPVTAPGMRSTVDASLTISRPSLWTIRAPHLYTLTATIEPCSGYSSAPSDSVSIAIGFRTLLYTADGGFSMNGDRVKVRGFCDHNNFGS